MFVSAHLLWVTTFSELNRITAELDKLYNIDLLSRETWFNFTVWSVASLSMYKQFENFFKTSCLFLSLSYALTVSVLPSKNQSQMTYYLIFQIAQLISCRYCHFVQHAYLKSTCILFLLYLSGLKKMEGLLTKNNWLRFPPKPKEAKLNIMEEIYYGSYQQDLDPTIHYITSVNVP